MATEQRDNRRAGAESRKHNRRRKSTSPRTRVDRRTRAARAERRDARARLLDAAADVFVARGYQDASIEEIAERAGYSKGAVYWHFDSKQELFAQLLEERVDRPALEMIELLESAPPEQDMGPEASARFVALTQSERELLLLENERWARAVRDPKLRAAYARRRARLRKRLGAALVVRLQRLNTPVDAAVGEQIAAVVMGLSAGLARERLVDPRSVSDTLLGDTIVLLYKGFAGRG